MDDSSLPVFSLDLDFFELDEKNSDIGPPQISVQPQQQAEWGEVCTSDIIACLPMASASS